DGIAVRRADGRRRRGEVGVVAVVARGFDAVRDDVPAVAEDLDRVGAESQGVDVAEIQRLRGDAGVRTSGCDRADVDVDVIGQLARVALIVGVHVGCGR